MTDPEKTSKPVPLRCRLNYPDEETFIRKYAAYISKNAVFAKTSRPRAVGEEILFEFSLSDGTELLRGLGRVAWNRTDSKEAPPGMSIRILKLGKKGKAMLARIAAYKEQRKYEVGEIRETPTPPAAGAFGQPAERSIRGADTDMTDQNRKSTVKIDLDAIDSMLDQIAKEPVSKKKRVVHRRRTTAAHASTPAKVEPSVERVSAPAAALETEEAPASEAPAPEAVAGEIPDLAAADPVPAEADVSAAESETPASEAETEPSEVELSAVAATPFASDESLSVEDSAPVEAPEPEEEEVEELTADEMVLEVSEIESTEIDEDADDAVMDLGPESETFQDVELTENISVESVVPHPPSEERLSSVPPTASSSAPPAFSAGTLPTASSIPPAVSMTDPVVGSVPPPAPVELQRPSVPAAPRIDPHAPIYGSSSSVSAAPPVLSSYPPAPSSYPPPVNPSFAPGVDPHAPIYSSSPPPAPPVYASSAPPIAVYDSSAPPMPPTPSVVPSPLTSAMPPRPSQAPVIAMDAAELQGILGAPTNGDVEIRTEMIQEDELDALLSALEDGQSAAADVNDIEEINDFDELEVVEVDD